MMNPLLFRTFAYELRAILSRLPVLMVLGGGIFLYGLMYNLMYAPNVLREVPVAVVDQSHTPQSRRLARMLDATPQVKVVSRNPDWPAAVQAMRRGEVKGIVCLPPDFGVRPGRGEEAVFTVYSTTEAFLFLADIQEAASGVMLALADEERPLQAVFLPAAEVPVLAQTPAVRVVGFPLYNPTDGYATYLIPAVLMVILFQTMMMLVSMLSGKEYEQRMRPVRRLTRGDFSMRSVAWLIGGKVLVYLAFYALFSLFLLGLLPLAFGLPHLAEPVGLVCLLLPYLTATACFALACSYFFRDSDAPLLLITFFSVGLIFLSGMSYPLELMPEGWRVFRLLLPAAPGTLAFVKLNSMEAGLSGIAEECLLLWGQCVVYFGLACVAYRKKLCRRLSPDSEKTAIFAH